MSVTIAYVLDKSSLVCRMCDGPMTCTIYQDTSLSNLKNHIRDECSTQYVEYSNKELCWIVSD